MLAYYSCPLCNILRSFRKFPPVWVAVDMLALQICPMCAEELEEDGVAAPKQIGFAGGSGGGRPESQLVNAVSDHMLEVCDD